ncbi:BRICHOS domain [Mactra antiquata]
MTIIKGIKDGKIIEKKKADETVVPLSPVSTESAARTLHISYVPSSRSKRLVNVFLLIMALLVLSAGIIGGVYIYKYMQHRHKMARISVQYQDNDDAGTGMYYTMEEDVDILVEDNLERIEVPELDECRRSIVLHDFQRNYTSIVDIEDKECFIMDLDRATMSPPKSFAELLSRHASGYYMPKVDVVRKQYEVVTPALTDLSFAGPSIMAECAEYDSYALEKKEHVPLIEFHFRYVKTYGYSDLKHMIKDYIYKK